MAIKPRSEAGVLVWGAMPDAMRRGEREAFGGQAGGVVQGKAEGKGGRVHAEGVAAGKERRQAERAQGGGGRDGEGQPGTQADERHCAAARALPLAVGDGGEEGQVVARPGEAFAGDGQRATGNGRRAVSRMRAMPLMLP